MTFVMYELRHKLEDLEGTLYRFDRERKESIPNKPINLAANRRQEERKAKELEKTVNHSLAYLQDIKESISQPDFATSQTKA